MDQTRDWLSVTLAEEQAESPQLRTVGDSVGKDFFPELEPHLERGRSEQLLLSMFFEGPQTPLLQMRVLTPLRQEVEGARIRIVRRAFWGREP